jgi:hypothetical protein
MYAGLTYALFDFCNPNMCKLGGLCLVNLAFFLDAVAACGWNNQYEVGVVRCISDSLYTGQLKEIPFLGL